MPNVQMRMYPSSAPHALISLLNRMVTGPQVACQCGIVPNLHLSSAAPATQGEKEFMTQDHLSIEVIDTQLGEHVNILFNHPQKHVRPVTLAQHDTCTRWVICCVCRHIEIAYVFVGEQAPSGLLTRIVGHAKVLLIDS